MELSAHFGLNIRLLAAASKAKRRPLNAGEGVKGYTPEELAELYFSMMMKGIVTLLVLCGGLAILMLGLLHDRPETAKLVCGLMGAVVGYWLR